MSDFDRREFLKALAFCLTYPALGLGGCTSRPLLPELNNTQGINLEQFVTLSGQITRADDLDAEVSREIYGIFMHEPWGPENLRKIYTRIRNLQLNSGDDDIFFLDKNNFTDDEQWFISHLLMTWYTGVYFHSSGNRHVTLKHALMYKKLTPYRQAKTYCSGGYGDWGRPPAVKS